ncbi:MAG: TIGR00341 family protein [Patescibacteria group bacterium]|nr:TIGR00341 family protein [Patescibacteria group bacterium]
MVWSLFSAATEKEKEDAIEAIIQHASPRKEFFLMMILAVSMAVFGVLLDSTVIIIGSMLIAPMLYPLLSLALGIIMPDERLIGRSLLTLGKSVGFSLAVGFLIGIFFTGRNPDGIALIDLIAGSQPSLMYAAVAVIAGFAGSYAMTRAHLNETLPGVAISVALVPPLAVAGVGLADFDWVIASNALVLFVVNVAGIVFSSVLVFSLFGFSRKKSVEQQVVKKEDKIIASEAKVEEEKPAV